MTDEESLKRAERETNTNPTEEQKISGDYQKGRFITEDLEIVVENPAGSTRSGVDNNGDTWSNKMLYTYGYISNTLGSDGDEIDVFLGPKIGEKYEVYIIFQKDPEKELFDEHKVMLGFDSLDSAREAYLSNYPSDWKGLSSINTLSITDFKAWLNNKVDNREVMVKEEVKVIKLEGEVVENETLLDLKKQAGDLTHTDTLAVEIASPGGSVYEGLEIMVWLNSLSEEGKTVVTIVTANAYSIASLIMLAANYRFISRAADIMVHNPMVPELTYANADKLESHAVKLRELEGCLHELYQNFTGLPIERVKELMDKETYLNSTQALEYNFVDEIVDLKERPKALATNKHKIKNMSKALNILQRVIAKVSNSSIVNQLYYDNTGGEIEIYQTNPATYEIGDRTNLENGEVTLADGAVVTITDFVISDIKRAVETVDSFNEGPAPEVEKTTTEEAPKAEETVTTEEAPKTEEVTTEEAPKTEETCTEETPKMETLVNPEDPTIVAIWKAIEELKGMVNSEMVKKISDMEKFQDIATEAIETIANNTSSSFKPEATFKGVEALKGSIFKQALAKAGLDKK